MSHTNDYLEKQIDKLQDKLDDLRDHGASINSRAANSAIRRFMMNVCLDSFENESFRAELMRWKAAES